eukprot:CAMPEP_0203665334 /NCGR_PEP_ID=MMETSP0090-20130426/2567_1 /ASSEMBLY_ACC=CAM_ASM_001088 /TAXON_ID=426623 /ORGANISM="Chaetoceros affinis, Strain CCMP159" /LENGTH=817 /DNA_ID=CAMNT_0050528851 /DNA_START=79 /DNA_END=2532 /DNA_ORIENTATION=+
MTGNKQLRTSARNTSSAHQQMKMKCILLTALLTLSSHLLPTAEAILPTAAIDIQINDPTMPDPSTVYTLLASQGNFAPMPPMDSDLNPKLVPLLPPQDDPLLCGTGTPSLEQKQRVLSALKDDATTAAIDTARRDQSDGGEGKQKFAFLVPRGSCTFQEKALTAQKYGASGVIIYGTLSSRYGYNETTSHIIYPQEYYDYDCSKKKGKGFGKAYIPASELIDFDTTPAADGRSKPYNSANDQLLAGDNLCFRYSDYKGSFLAFEKQCPSQQCLLTGNTTTSDQNPAGALMEACCAWDTHVFLYHDDAMYDPETGRPYEPINIPSFYITMEESSTLLNTLNARSASTEVTLTMYSRWYPKYNVATVLIWAVGVFVAALASYLSASEIHHATKMIQNGSAEQGSDDTGSTESIDNSGNDTQSSNNGSPATTVSMRGYERVVDETGSNETAREHRGAIPPEETLELTPLHAIFFLVFSSAGLLTLFFFKIYNVVKIFYAFGCSGAIMQCIVIPSYLFIAKKLNIRDRVAVTIGCGEIGPVTVIELLAVITSYGLGGVWLYIAFTCHHPDTILFFWVMQDIMGMCMCIMFLKTMKLNSIKVASILLIAAFFYDIFFVFVTPYLTKGGKSIMVDVATSGGPPTADPSWCEKYPDGPECQGGDPLPMLFTIPRINDYAGGSSLLGLGDIVLPGLLLSFAARYDAAKKLVSASHSPSSRRMSSSTCRSGCGYFVPSVIGYAIGLAMANVAVYVMRMGQPALLYLVPCCLGVIVFLGWKRGELSDLWNTPKVLLSCDQILYGTMEEKEELVRDEQDTLGSTRELS